jgi:putative spermidine/putrescine transport system substrate-binding protein
MSSSNSNKISRRDFIKLAGTTAGAMAYLTACGGTGGGSAAGPDLTSGESIPLDDLIKAAQAEGELTTIALPHDWANYGEMLETFKSKYGLTVNELNPDAGSADSWRPSAPTRKAKARRLPT